jgi:hypothetical protein
VAPAFAHFRVVEQNAAVTHGITDRVDPKVYEFVDGRRIEAFVHGRFVDVDVGVSTIGVKDDFVVTAHGGFLGFTMVGLRVLS